jgi:hypothetical protein
VFKGTAGTDQEIKKWLENISSSDSPEQINASIDEAIELLGSRLYALRDQYERGLGKPKDFKFLSAKSDELLRKIGADPRLLDPVNGENRESTAIGDKPIAPTNKKGWKLHVDAKGNKAYVSPDGKQFEEVK